ncbi:CHAT domain-containing protein [Ekhidna sp.]
MRFFVILLICALNSYVFAQSKKTTLIDSLMKDGQQLLDNSLHEESIKVYSRVKALSIEIDSMEVFFTAENRIIQNLWRLNKLEEAQELASKNLEKELAHFGPTHKIVGETYLQKGIICMFQGENQQAVDHFKETERISKPLGKEGLSGLSAVYVNMGYIYIQTGNFEELLKTYKKAYEIDKELYGNDHLFVAEDLNNLASIYIDRGMNDRAIEYLENAVNILVRLKNTGSLYADVLGNLGKAFINTNQFRKGHELFNKSIQIYTNLFGEENLSIASFYHTISYGFKENENFDSSLYYLKKCLVFEEDLKKSNPYNQVFIYRDLSRCYSETGDSAKALAYNDKAFQLVDNTSKSSDLYGILFDNRSKIYSRFKAYDQAVDHLKSAIDNYTQNSKSYLFATWRNLALVYRDSGDLDDALIALQESMKFNHLHWNYENVYDNPPLEGVIDQEDLFDALDIKAEVLSSMYQRNPEKIILEAALAAYELLNKTIINQRIDFTRIQDKIDLSSYTHRIYEGAIELNHLAYLHTKNEEYLKNCFYYSEVDKSVTLSEVLSERTLLKEILAPEIIDLEQDLKLNINHYHSMLLNESDSLKIDFYQSRLFVLNQKKDSLLEVIKNNHQDHFKSRYRTSIPSIDKIQSKLESKTAVLEYFVGDNTTYGFLLTNKHSLIQVIGESQPLVGLIKDFNSGFENAEMITDDLLINSSLLYDKLIMPFENTLEKESIDKLVIIPSGATHLIPFDLLVKSTKKDPPKNFKEAEYLIKRYSIRINYIADFQNTDHVRSNAPKVLAFAPSYDNLTDPYRLEQLTRFRDDYVPLKWNDDEIATISNFFSTDENQGESATEQNFKKKAKAFDVLHLAMHAFVDDDDPMKSKFVFTNSIDSTEDNLLHTFELFNMDLEADLAILSACKTGTGKLVNGEGVISLAKGFSYAGVQNVIMSYWQVDDESTSELMSHYYELLADGKGKSEALRLSKLHFLENASPNKSHPFFWGAFVLVGDDYPLVRKNNLTFIILLFSLIVLLTFLYFLKQRFT